MAAAAAVRKKQTFFDKYGSDLVRSLMVAMLTFVINMLVGIRNDLTDIKIQQAEGQERGRQRSIAIDELKTDTRVIRLEIQDLKQQDAVLKEQVASLEETTNKKPNKN